MLITAVHKASTQPKLHFFNNCFGDEFSTRERSATLGGEAVVLTPASCCTEPVWKVARYTSAATEFENYVDGGVLANNPCDEGLIKIQSHYRHLGVRILIPCVVSIGCGVYPASDTVCCSTCGVAGNTIVYSTSGRSDNFIVSDEKPCFIMQHPLLLTSHSSPFLPSSIFPFPALFSSHSYFPHICLAS